VDNRLLLACLAAWRYNSRMSTRFVNVDRNTPMLLPPDLRDWVAGDDMVHFVIEAVNGMRLTNFRINARGTGSAQYPPKMMLALLIYCYANSIFSSRKIERATYRDVAVRFIAGNHHPDHDTIARFRRQNLNVVTEAFKQVLLLAKKLDLLKVGTISIDGTHIAASASKDRNVRYDRAGELEAKLNKDIEELLNKAEQADENNDDDQALPDEINRREKLLAKMQQARAELEQQAKERAQAKQAENEQNIDESSGIDHGDDAPPMPVPKPADKDQINLTDSDSRLMRKTHRSAYTQSYNAVAAVDVNTMLILSQHVTQCASDVNELIPAYRNIDPQLGKVQTVLADSGFAKIEMFETLEKEVDLYVAVCRDDNQRRYDYRPSSATQKPPKPVKHETLVKMKAKLQTDEGRRKYGLRKQTVEPVFGIIKSVMGFRQFLLRGFEKVTGEWCLVTLAFNLKRMANLRAG